MRRSRPTSKVALPATVTMTTLMAVVVAACASLVDLQSSSEPPPTTSSSTPANPTPSKGDGGNNAADSGFEGDGAQQTSTLRCGDEECLVGRDVCCVQGATARCIQGESCPMTGPVDAGVDAAKQPPPLRCTSYTQCSNFQTCCYHPDEGSKCTGQCNFPRISLCTGFDWCSISTSCLPMSNPPAPNVKQCR